MSGSIKLKHASGNGVIISAPSSNPAADRTLTLPSDSDGVIAKTDADGNITMGDFASPTDLNTAQVPTLFVDRVDNNIFGEDGALYITQNAYFSNSGSYKRITTARPLQYKQRLGKHKFLVGDSGSAGGNVTFSEAVIIDADGLKFNGDTSSANALNDYEEGTFSITYSSTTLSSQTNPTTEGLYTKIGDIVHFQCRIKCGSSSVAGGQIIITGLPFTHISTNAASGAYIVLSQMLGSNNARLVISNTQVEFQTLAGSAFSSNTSGLNFNGEFHFAGIYKTA